MIGFDTSIKNNLTDNLKDTINREKLLSFFNDCQIDKNNLKTDKDDDVLLAKKYFTACSYISWIGHNYDMGATLSDIKNILNMVDMDFSNCKFDFGLGKIVSATSIPTFIKLPNGEVINKGLNTYTVITIDFPKTPYKIIRKFQYEVNDWKDVANVLNYKRFAGSILVYAGEDPLDVFPRNMYEFNKNFSIVDYNKEFDAGFLDSEFIILYNYSVRIGYKDSEFLEHGKDTKIFFSEFPTLHATTAFKVKSSISSINQNILVTRNGVIPDSGHTYTIGMENV